MKINYLKLSNIGPYVGEHLFSLNTNSKQNIVLIGGKNGAGKTTFLKSIKYGLFGCFSLGLKTETNKYFEEIHKMINNKSKSNFFIEISFEFVENFEVKNYVFKRSWKISLNDISEILEIKCNDIQLNEFECKEIQDKLRAITSPQLINSFIFDGEKISSIIEEGFISSYLEETFNSIFNIDMINQTIKDFDNYMAKRAIENNVKEQIENVNLVSEIDYEKKQIKILESQLNEQKQLLNNLYTIKKSNMENFYKLGGIDKSQQQKIEREISQFSKEKDSMNLTIKNFIESDLPIYLNVDLLSDTLLQSKYERQSQYPKMFSEIQMFLGKQFPEIEKMINDLVNDCNSIHNLTEESNIYLEERFLDVQKTSYVIKGYLNSKYIKNDEYKLLKKKLNDSDNIERINELLEENEINESKIQNMINSIDEIEKKIIELKEKLNLNYSLYEKIREELKKSSLYDSSFLMADSMKITLEKYKKKLISSKLKKVSELAFRIFNDTIRKKDFVKEFKILDNFEIELKNKNNININTKTLSAGEMQILVSSLIWAMFNVSGRREMFIFDTPLARLDKENRSNFINKIISTISSQVVILSTDSEFVDDNLKLIENNIYKNYILEYDVNKSLTNVIEGYF